MPKELLPNRNQQDDELMEITKMRKAQLERELEVLKARASEKLGIKFD